MALRGRGLLAIWNGITPAGEEEFVNWHIREHIPERVGVKGFLRGRRYVAEEGHPKYFNFYETETPQTLDSPEYRGRLNAPTPWTQAVIKEFRDTSRTVCEVAATTGAGEGAWIETIQIGRVKDDNGFSRDVVGNLIPDLVRHPGIIGAHLVRGIDDKADAPTVENRLRGQPDAKCEWLLLVEAAEIEFLKALRSTVCSDEVLRRSCPGASIERGIYRLQYGLTREELG